MTAEVVVFARPPVPGRVKTRLAQDLGPEAATAVYRALLDHTLEQARVSGLAVALALTEPLEPGSSWVPPAGVTVVLQAPGDLGTRMRRAFTERFLLGSAAVLLVGSDLPELSPTRLQEAAAALGRAPVVLGPAADGGYWLVGQRAPGVDLFAGVPWSSPRTLAATRARLRALGVVHQELATLRDLDTQADLRTALAAPALAGELRRRLVAALARERPPD